MDRREFLHLTIKDYLVATYGLRIGIGSHDFGSALLSRLGRATRQSPAIRPIANTHPRRMAREACGWMWRWLRKPPGQPDYVIGKSNGGGKRRDAIRFVLEWFFDSQSEVTDNVYVMLTNGRFFANKDRVEQAAFKVLEKIEVTEDVWKSKQLHVPLVQLREILKKEVVKKNEDGCRDGRKLELTHMWRERQLVGGRSKQPLERNNLFFLADRESDKEDLEKGRLPSIAYAPGVYKAQEELVSCPHACIVSISPDPDPCTMVTAVFLTLGLDVPLAVSLDRPMNLALFRARHAVYDALLSGEGETRGTFIQ